MEGDSGERGDEDGAPGPCPVPSTIKSILHGTTTTAPPTSPAAAAAVRLKRRMPHPVVQPSSGRSRTRSKMAPIPALLCARQQPRPRARRRRRRRALSGVAAPRARTVAGDGCSCCRGGAFRLRRAHSRRAPARARRACLTGEFLCGRCSRPSTLRRVCRLAACEAPTGRSQPRAALLSPQERPAPA